MTLTRFFAIALLCLPAVAQPPSRGPGRGAPSPPPELTAEQKNQYQSKIAELESMVKSFRAKKVNPDLIADVDIYAKAGSWLLEYPQGFVNAQGVASYL